MNVKCPGGEIGRHAAFRALCSPELGGSSPLLGTILSVYLAFFAYNRYKTKASPGDDPRAKRFGAKCSKQSEETKHRTEI
jgi:hypothetical protein